ncbi:HAD family hydrolase [Marinobacterium sp. YM272]|uniref:HAD family hydrolase n=1 Tax=Marinobacterium sp. YM272 TaxID=3421654 RepID=UPI003D7F3BB3
MPAVRAVLFDLDGTLLDTALDFYWVIDKMLADRQRPPVDRATFRQYVSEGARAMVSQAFDLPATTAQTDQLLTEFLTLYQHNLMVEARLFEGLEQLLEQLEAREIPWGIVTNKPERFSRLILQKLKLDRRCATLICPEHVSNRKPDPESLHLACEQLHCRPEEAIYLGDHLRDIEAGLAAGMPTIACAWGYLHKDDDPESWQADHVIRDTRELGALLNCL